MMYASRGTIEWWGQSLRDTARRTNDRLTDQSDHSPQDTQELVDTLDSFFTNARHAPSWDTVFRQAVMTMAFFDDDPESGRFGFRNISDLDRKLKDVETRVISTESLALEADRTTQALYEMIERLQEEVSKLREEMAPVLSAYQINTLIG